MAQEVKNLPAKQEMQVQSLDRKGILEEEMVTHSSILAWRIPWTEESGRPTVPGVSNSWIQLSSCALTHARRPGPTVEKRRFSANMRIPLLTLSTLPVCRQGIWCSPIPDLLLEDNSTSGSV